MCAPNNGTLEENSAVCSSVTNPPFAFAAAEPAAACEPKNVFDLFVQALFSAPAVERKESNSPDDAVEETIVVPKLKALVVEGAEPHTHELCASLRSFGFDTLAAESSEQALQIVTTQPISILIVDWELPDGHGLVLAHAVRAMKRVKQPLIIGIASNLANEVKELALHTGIDIFCDKPVSPDAIATCLIANGFSIREPDYIPPQSEPPMIDFREFGEGAPLQRSQIPLRSAAG